MMNTGGRALNWLGGISLTKPYQTPNAGYFNAAVRLRKISSVVKREKAQITS